MVDKSTDTSEKLNYGMTDGFLNSEVCGSCEGADAMYVKLISSDGHEFIIKRANAMTSGTIKVKSNSNFPPFFAILILNPK